MAIILIVQDEIFRPQNAEWMMEEMGHQPLVACVPGDAIVHLCAEATIDAHFADMRLSEFALGGYDVANQAIALKPGLRLLHTCGTPLTADMTARFVPGEQLVA